MFQLCMVLCAATASAQTSGLPNSSYSILQSDGIRDIIRLVAAYGEDHRQLEEDYSRSHNMQLQELKDSFSPTGVINCGGYRSTAQVTLSSSVITTAAHTLIDTVSCKVRTNPRLCRFTYTYHGRADSIPIKSLYKEGLTCPFDSNKADDWAVLTLQRPTVGPIPYKIDESKTLAANDGDPILAIEALSVDFCSKKKIRNICERDPRGQFILPRTIQDCVLKSVEYPDAMLFLTDCAGSHGASGSGIFLETNPGQYYLIGINYTDAKTDREDKTEISHGTPILKPYDRKTWSASEIPVTGNFASAIRDAGKGN